MSQRDEALIHHFRGLTCSRVLTIVGNGRKQAAYGSSHRDMAEECRNVNTNRMANVAHPFITANYQHHNLENSIQFNLNALF